MDELLPAEDEVYMWVVSAVKHSFHVEYYLKHFSKLLELEFPDPERPHDLDGPGNKLEWGAIKGFSLQYRESGVDFDTYVKPSLEFHRQQYHHQKWNGSEPSPDASEEDMTLGAIDAVCSLREPRAYQGGVHSWGDVIKISQDNPAHKVPYLLGVIPLMLSIGEPDLESITSLSDIPNIGLDQPVYEAIVKRTNEALEMLRNEHGYIFDGGGKYGIL